MAFRTYRLGEASLEALGDGTAEFEAEDCLEGDVETPFGVLDVVSVAVAAAADGAAAAAAGLVVERGACW